MHVRNTIVNFHSLQLSSCGTCLTVSFSSFQLVFNKTIGLKEDSGKNIS